MQPKISIVLPAQDEAGSIGALLLGIDRAMAGTAHEILVIDDGSTDATLLVLREMLGRLPQLRVICHARPCGQSAAIRSGVLAARGKIIATLDADGQNPPENLPRLIAPLLEGPSRDDLGLVQGQRIERKDSFSKRVSSKIGNAVRNAMLRDGVRDSGCGLKAFPRAVYLSLPYFDHIHRFMPAMVLREGWRVETVPVSHAPRLSGRSKYGNLRRALAGVVDLCGVAWLIRRRSLAKTAEISASAGDHDVAA